MDDCQQEAVFVADVIRAAGMEPARVSEAARALGVRSASKGTYRKQLTVEDAVRIVATRRLQEVGVTFAAAIEAVRQVSFEVLKDIIISDEQRFLVVAPDGRVSVCNVSQLAELAVAGGGIRNLQLINLRTVIEDLFVARLQRVKAAKAKAQKYVAKQQRVDGVVIDGLSIAVVRGGRGNQMRLTPAEARAIAEQLIAVAEEHGGSALEKLN